MPKRIEDSLTPVSNNLSPADKQELSTNSIIPEMYNIQEKTDNIVEDNYKEDNNRRDSTISKNCNCSNTKGPRIQLKYPSITAWHPNFQNIHLEVIESHLILASYPCQRP
jgi:hypothetical protein